MWYNIFKFEIQYRIRRADTYVFFLFLFLFSIVGVDFVFQGVDLGVLKKNSPIVVAKAMGAITGIFMILASMIMGVSVLRDFEYEIASLMFSTPIRKKDYLMGRFLGSFAILVIVFSGVFFGLMLGEFMPWHKPDDLLPFNILTYLSAFVQVTLPILFFGAALFFVSGTLSRKLVVVYTQGIIFFVMFMLTKAITNDTIQAILDPFSLTTLTLITDAWTPSEKCIQSIPFIGLLLINKLVWITLGLIILFYGYKKFNLSSVKKGQPKSKRVQTLDAGKSYDSRLIKVPNTKVQTSIAGKWKQLRHFSWFYFVSIFKQPSFWGIVICGMIIILINSVNLGTVYGVDSYPATYFIVEELQETSIYFFIIIMVFYSGELMWKERGAKLNLIYDATGMSSFMNVLGKYIGLNLIYIVLMLALILSGVIFQTLNGYYNYEFQVYFYGFFLEILPFLALYTCLSFFVQALVNHKFIGIMIVTVVFILIVFLGVLGFNHNLYLFGGSSLGSYSDMNGYGDFLKPYLFIKTYWMLFGILLLVISSLLLVRGMETQLLRRIKMIRHKVSTRLMKFSSGVTIAFIILGSFIFYNTNVLNIYWTDADAVDFRIAYEKTLKKFEYIPQPKLVDVYMKLELYPELRHYVAEGQYILKNATDHVIKEVHIQKQIESNTTLDNVTFEGGSTPNNTYKTYDYVIYELQNALQPGDSVKMNFKQTYRTRGFQHDASNENIVENGTFFNNNDFPSIGYNKKYELNDSDDRADNNLPKRLNKASREDYNELGIARSGSDSDGIQLEMIVGTHKDQTAIVPGNLLRQWTENDRNYFHYKTDQTIINFYAVVSGEYITKKGIWTPSSSIDINPVNLEIYYHEGHDYNVDRMMTSMQSSLAYFSKNFGPYQYEHLRIMEFPRYAQFAQSFPGTVPFSESIGFILDIDDHTDVDMAFYVTAHEIAHQWFGMQVEAANVKGKHFILETLSQYAAVMVLKHYYSEDKVLQFLEFQKETYKDGQVREQFEEPSLALVENQEYVYYAKGVINMYEFQKVVGEQQVNLAIKQFIRDWNTTDGLLKTKTYRYATTKDLLSYFRDIVPEDQQHIVSDLFEE
ncbi:M1 family aminopeptidase [uncultured Psychroserpens sp.]|uniref:ABC transporter permease/M1 family aminopeptidase n=1 Tax=uncultured Psychroserpens sp. TaxID=255436 RepID=UPI002634B2FB|nr:M1 family aminopeptidase [uncultured Psychroserpens sp.]